MDDMDSVKAIAADIADSLELVGQRIGVGTEFSPVTLYMGEDAISLTLADVKGFAVAGIDEAIDVGAKLLRNGF
jgi:predicted regulator of Ras-like GTPase activity (Roadblock/LC7/MglB family)